MPPRTKRTYRKRPNFRKKKYNGNRKGSLSKTPSIYRFKRETDELVALTGTPDSWTLNSDNTLAKTFAFALNSVGNFSEFQALFKYYRIKGARVRMYFSNNVSRAEQSQNESSNKQIMIQMDRNMDGVSIPDINSLLQSQTKKRFIALQNTRKPSVDVYMPLKQATELYATAGTATGLISPKWLNTADTASAGVPHYGFNINMGRVDRSGFSSGISNSQYVRIITTLYIECKKVQ